VAHARATGEIDAPADVVYELLADFGDVGWMRGVTRVEVEGKGPGMRRSIFAGGDEAVVEELESVDPGALRVSYTIPHNNPLPVADYQASCTAVDLGGGRSRLDWEADFTPVGVDEDAAVARVEAMYGVLIGWVKSALEEG
jgi:hypothetical protein